MVATIGERPVYTRKATETEAAPPPPPPPPPKREPGVRERSAAAAPTASATTARAPAAAMRGDVGMRASHLSHRVHSAFTGVVDNVRGVLHGGQPPGPRLNHIDQGWIPQGQGHDAKRGEVLTTYYRGHDVMLSMQDKKSGDQTHQVRLGGLPCGVEGGPAPAPSHGGGVSTDGKNVYVSDTDRIYVYNRKAIEAAERRGVAVEPSQVMDVPKPDDLKDPATGIGLVSAGSYMTVKDGYAYVGGYSKDGDDKAGAVWRYAIDEKTGALVEDSRQGPIRAPDRAQGITVVDGAMLFTTGDHKLMHQPFDERSFTADIDDRTDIANGKIDPYAQGLNIIDGQLWVTYESGADKYRSKVDVPREHIQRIPLDQLDLEAAGLTRRQLARG